jgi:hypothetical protein
MPPMLVRYTFDMSNTERQQAVKDITSSRMIGVSFSVKNCREYNIDWRAALKDTIGLGFKRFRLMSYWDMHEPMQGTYDFNLLQEQIKIITKAGGQVTQCLGIRQPRWPETHMPQWAKDLPHDQAVAAYLKYQYAAVQELKKYPAIISWQLENEFWLRSFGESFDFDRNRLRTEFVQLCQQDPTRPIIMSLANTFSLPLRGPKPDIYATSMYRNLYDKGTYRKTYFSPLYYRIKRLLIRLMTGCDLIIHELQMEPWGPQANWFMSDDEQAKSYDASQIDQTITFARKSGINYIDAWGAEWWYWRKTAKKDVTLTKVLKKLS